MAMKDQNITSNNTQAEDEMLSLSDPFSPMYTQTPQGEMLLQRRRRTNEKGKTKKRRLSGEQVKLLELSFCSEHTLKSERRDRLASEVGLDPHVVAVWFQNRRARWKAKHLEEEYEKLKMVNQTLLIDKCRLEAEILKLQVQVSEAKKEIQKLSGRFEGVWCGERSCSASSPLSVDAFQPFLEEVAAEENENFLYFPEYCYNDDMKWVSLYSL